MKKISLLAMSLMMTLFVTAQEDATNLLANASFDAQTSAEQTPVTGWEGEFQTQTASYPNFTGTFAEKWCGSYKTGTGQVLEEAGKTYYLLSDFSCSQTIDVENGVYVLGAYVIANNQDLTRLNPVHGVLLCANEDTTSCTSGNGVPEWHQVSTVVTDGKLTVALRTRSTTANWVAWDGIVLTRYIGETVEEAQLAWVLDELEKVKETVAVLLESTIQTSIAAELQDNVDAIVDVKTYAEGEALLNTINALVEEAEASLDAYQNLLAAIEAANYELDRDFTEGLDEFYAAIDIAQDLYDNPTASVAEVEDAISKLNEDIFIFQMLNAEGTIEFDVTNKYVTNPTMRKGSEGWEGSEPSLEFEVMEFYNCNFDMYQKLTDVPNGMYVLRVQGFYRTGANDAGAAYQAGTENISAVLYANESSAPMVSMYKYTASEMGVTNEQVLDDYVNMRVAANEAFNQTNPALGILYYAENEVSVLVQDGNLTIGIRNSNYNSTSWCAFRDFKLSYYGNFPGAVLLAKINEAQAWLDEQADVLPVNAYNQLSDYMMDIDDYTEPGYEEDEVFVILAEFDSIFASVKNVLGLQNELKELVLNAEPMFELEYPGINDFVTAYEIAESYIAEGIEVELEDGVSIEQFFQQVIADFKAAIDAYYFSQDASPESPANYTHKIILPTFVEPGGAKSYTIPAPWVVANVQNGGDIWVGPCQPDAAGDGSTQLPGFNSWSNNFTSMNVYQDIEGLPNGVYTVTARAITQGLGAQHAYATSSIGTSVSPDMTMVGWDSYEWETLTTEKAVVLDGKLRVGFASTSAGDVNGWYQVTDFTLLYYGAATADDLKAVWESTLERANEMVAVLLPGDSKVMKDAIAAATSIAEDEKYAEAAQALTPAIEASDSLYQAVQKFFKGNYQTLVDLAAELDATLNPSSEVVLVEVLSMAEDLFEAEDATHKLLDPLSAKLGGYVAYVSYLIEAENILATIKGVRDEYIAFVKYEVIAPQVADLVAELRTADDCEDLLSKLKKAIQALQSVHNLNLSIGDVTSDLIVNPTVDDEQASGWIVNKGTGNGPTITGQHYDGSTSNRYIDSWNGTTGALNFTAYQEILGLPNGIYRLTVATRSDGENAWVFAAPQPLEADTAQWAEAAGWAMVKKYYADHGEIWYADSLAFVASDGTIEAPYFNANNAIGWGWSYDTVQVEVTRHYLAIGITANSELTCKEPFKGTWMSADDWRLELISKAAAQNTYDPFTGIESVEAVAPVRMGTYDLFGRRVDTPTVPGIYIIDGKKVVIKK